MANRHRGEVTVELDGERYTMRPSFEALAEIEDRTGIGLLGLLMRIRDTKTTDIASVIYAGIAVGHGTKIEEARVRDAIVDKGVAHYIEPAGDFITQALWGDDQPELDEPEKKTRKQEKPLQKAG